MNLFKIVTFLIINLIWSSCSTPTTNSNMKDTTSQDENTLIRIESSLPTPIPSTMAMFSLGEEDGEYKLPNGELAKGQLVRIFSTDSDDSPEHLVGIGSEFEMVGHKYRVVKIVLSENYEESGDVVWVEELDLIKE